MWFMVKNPPAMQEMQETQEAQVRSLHCEDPLEESMVTHSSILAWRIPRAEELGGLQSMGLQKVGTKLLTCTDRRRYKNWAHKINS